MSQNNNLLAKRDSHIPKTMKEEEKVPDENKININLNIQIQNIK